MSKKASSVDKEVQDKPKKRRRKSRDTDELYKVAIDQWTNAELGAEGERMAASFLSQRGFRILERNWRCAMGEVDIIAELEEDDPISPAHTHVLIEVKTRRSKPGDIDIIPELAVDRRKRDKYRQLALFYLSVHPKVTSVRFDVVALNIEAIRCAHVRHLQGAYACEE